MPAARIEDVNALAVRVAEDYVSVDAKAEAARNDWSSVGSVRANRYGGILPAMAANPGAVVDMEAQQWADDSVAGFRNLYGTSKYRKAMHKRVQVGRVDASGNAVVTTTDASPMLVYQKFSAADRSADPTAWDQVGYFGLHKSAGTAFGAALTGYAEAVGGSGDMIGVHARAVGRNAGSEIFGGWSYAMARPAGDTGYIKEAVIHEFDLVNRGSSATFTEQFGTYRGIIVATADSSLAGHIAVDVKKGISALEGWLVGARFAANGIEPTSIKGNTKQLLIEGATTTGSRYGGVSFEGGYFTYGIDASRVAGDFSNNLFMKLKPGQRIGWADNVTRYMVAEAGTGTLNFENLSLAINGTQVIGARKTGWAGLSAWTGPRHRAGFDVTTVSTERLAEVVAALLDDLQNHGLIGA